MNVFKSLIIIVSTLFLFIGSIGVDVFSHFCKEDGQMISWFVEDNTHCEDHKNDAPPCCQDEDEDDDCCTDEVQHISVKLDYFNSVVLSPIIIPEGSIQLFLVSESEPIVLYREQWVPESPPPKSGRQVLTEKQYWLI